jgi:disulfide bond formation protein DsbB
MNPNPLHWPFRGQFAAGFLTCAGLLGYALYVQYHMLMMPCPMCILQRVAFVVMGLFFLVGAVHGPGRIGRRAYAVLVSLAAAGGAAVAGRHFQIQHLPADEIPLCTGMGLDYMLDAFPLTEVLAKVFAGSGECAKIDWSFLGLSMPGWTFICFVLLAIGALWAGFRKR